MALTEIDGIEVSVYRSKIDGRVVVQIETTDENLTTNGLTPLRVYLNDGDLYECDTTGKETYGS